MMMVFGSRVPALAQWKHAVATKKQAALRAKFILLANTVSPNPPVSDTYACINPKFLLDDTDCTVRHAHLQLLCTVSWTRTSFAQEHTQAQYPKNYFSVSQSPAVSCSPVRSCLPSLICSASHSEPTAGERDQIVPT